MSEGRTTKIPRELTPCRRVSVVTYVRYSPVTISIEKTFLQVFLQKSEAFASEFRENLEEMFLRYYTHIMITLADSNLQ